MLVPDLKSLTTLRKPAPARKPSQEQADQFLAEAIDESRSAPRSPIPAEPNPFVMETPAVERALTVMRECAEATRDRFELEP